MKTLLRCGFAALIVLSVAIQLTQEQRGNDDSDPLATLATGLERLNVHTDRSNSAEILTGISPFCKQPIHVMLLRTDGVEDERLREFPTDENVARFVYLGSVEEKRDQTTIISQWVWARARSIVGLRSVKPPGNLVVVMLPRACPGLTTLEWATLSPWD